jgi:60 kDa SS-A/Ro ribonucleoprotein
MSNALKGYTAGVQNTRENGTPQTVPTPGRTDEVRNNAGGFVFAVTPKVRLERFLILGVDGGTYYVSERNLVKQNVKFLTDLIAADEQMVIDTLRDVAVNNRAPKNTPSLFLLALLMHKAENKAAVRALVKDVARTSTHLFEYAQFLKDLGGLGRAKRGSLADWYTDKSADKLAYQVVKYRQRDGWTHRDVMRLAHPKGVDPAVGAFMLGTPLPEHGMYESRPVILEGFEAMQNAKSVKDVVGLLGTYKNLPWETIPTQFLRDSDVWKTLFHNGALGQTALIRNVTRLHEIGAFDDLVFAGDVAIALADSERIAQGRVHPVAYANARGMYGKNVRGANAKVLAALESGFYESFKTVEPANKPTMVALDVSGSMTYYAPAGLKGLNCMEAATIMAMVTVRTEPYVKVIAFDQGIRELSIAANDTLEGAMRKLPSNFGGTDIAQPMLYAKSHGLDIDGFAVYTDNETWAGNVKPNKALEQYRKARGRDARLVTVGMYSTGFTIADPTDQGMLDVVGFDSTAPSVISNFFAGRI